jgi:EAL domain-containing protein (putative c-di-GMP-specific phosphodiesterase class I)
MDAAKASPVRRVVRWNAEISHAAQVRVTEEEHVRNAIAAGDVQVHFQPIVDTEARRVDGLEALVRLPGAGAQVEAERIIAATRELGLTPSLAKLVCDRAFSEGALLRKYFPTASVSVNVSREFMASGRAMDVVIASAKAAGLSPGEVTLELTEEVAAGVSSSVLVSELRRGAEWGLAVVIDDFGRGETALSTLRGLPLSGIKLDRSLVPPDGDEDGWRFVEGIVSLLRTLARQVVAEGVESLTQSRRLRDIGVAMQQGFLFGEPQPAAFWTLHAAQPLAGLSLSDESAL